MTIRFNGIQFSLKTHCSEHGTPQRSHIAGKSEAVRDCASDLPARERDTILDPQTITARQLSPHVRPDLDWGAAKRVLHLAAPTLSWVDSLLLFQLDPESERVISPVLQASIGDSLSETQLQALKRVLQLAPIAKRTCSTWYSHSDAQLHQLLTSAKPPLAEPLRVVHVCGATTHWGVLVALRNHSTPASRSEHDALSLVASCVAGAMDNALLHAQREFLLKEAESLRAVISSCAKEETLEGILAVIIDRSIEVTGASDAQVLLLEESGDMFRVYARSPVGDGRLAADRMPFRGSLTARVVNSGQPLVCNDVLADPRANQELARRWGVRSLAIAPLQIRDKTIGTLAAINHRQDRFRCVDVDTLSSFVNHAAIVIDYVQLMEAEKIARNRFQEIARERQDLLSRTISIQEDERRRIAADVHDRVISRVVGALYELQPCLETQKSWQDMRQRVALAGDLLNEAVEKARASIYALWPPTLDHAGLIPALRQLLAGQEEMTGVQHRLEVTGSPSELESATRIAAYRIVQEALTNARRHALAELVHVSVAFRPSSLRVTVTDDGQGFDVDSTTSDRERDHFAIITMRERALGAGGHLEVHSQPGQGSQIVLILPLDGSRPE